ncbi:MAG: CopG family transcriptional regulator [Cyanobacteria bacterium K_DeepCast_35m_m1_288]|nr:CopG family transcriptional regulator [Cyanobacteria bacterium K_DeepCast_35m_m1_288]
MTGTPTVPGAGTVPVPLPITPAKAIRLSADIDAATAERIDRLAAQYRVPRAELLRAMVRQALQQQEG